MIASAASINRGIRRGGLRVARPVEVLPRGTAARASRRRQRLGPRTVVNGQYAVLATLGSVDVPNPAPLTPAEELRLIRRAQSGSAAARRALWLAHAAKAYTVISQIRCPVAAMPDAFQQAQFGLGRAIDRFDPRRGSPFAAYALASMRGWVLRHRENGFFSTRLPAGTFGRYYAFRSRVLKARTRAEWFDARAAYISRGRAKYEMLLRLGAVAEPVPLSEAPPLVAKREPDGDRLDRADLVARVRAAVEGLKPIHRFVLTRRYGLDGRAPATLQAIGASLGMTREGVRCHQRNAEGAVRGALSAVDQSGRAR